MSENSELRDINQKITGMEQTLVQILTTLTEQGTSLSFIKATIERVETDHSKSIDKLQTAQAAQAIQINWLESVAERLEKNEDRIKTPLVRKLIDLGFIGIGFIIYHYITSKGG